MNVLRIALLAMAVMSAGPAQGQSATPPPAPTAPLAIPSPMYTSLVLETAVNKSAEDVWGRIGRYCDLEEWLGFNAC